MFRRFPCEQWQSHKSFIKYVNKYLSFLLHACVILIDYLIIPICNRFINFELPCTWISKENSVGIYQSTNTIVFADSLHQGNTWQTSPILIWNFTRELHKEMFVQLQIILYLISIESILLGMCWRHESTKPQNFSLYQYQFENISMKHLACFSGSRKNPVIISKCIH